MDPSRRKFFYKSLGCLPLSTLRPSEIFGKASADRSSLQDEIPSWSFAELSLTIKQPVLIRSVELLKTQEQLLLVVTSADGIKGITQCNDRMQNLTSLLKGLVLPHFLKKDSRDVSNLVDNAYRLNSNYKYAGMPLWNGIGTVEIALWDLLGRTAQKPVYELL
jgi:L-alanine-DL-glutamate epimerase-like enolase superfamily enzyme